MRDIRCWMLTEMMQSRRGKLMMQGELLEPCGGVEVRGWE